MTGDEEVTIEYAPAAPIFSGRRTITGTVKEETGDLLYVATDMDGIDLVLDGDGELWAREDGHSDGLFGRYAEVVA